MDDSTLFSESPTPRKSIESPSATFSQNRKVESNTTPQRILQDITAKTINSATVSQAGELTKRIDAWYSHLNKLRYRLDPETRTKPQKVKNEHVVDFDFATSYINPCPSKRPSRDPKDPNAPAARHLQPIEREDKVADAAPKRNTVPINIEITITPEERAYYATPGVAFPPLFGPLGRALRKDRQFLAMTGQNSRALLQERRRKIDEAKALEERLRKSEKAAEMAAKNAAGK